MGQSEVIFEVGAEGGSLAIYGIRAESGWFFSRELIDQSSVLLEGGSGIQHTSQIVNSWERALSLLDKYPWQRLYPVLVHPEFRKEVFDAVLNRYNSTNDTEQQRLPYWKKLCGISEK